MKSVNLLLLECFVQTEVAITVDVLILIFRHYWFSGLKFVGLWFVRISHVVPLWKDLIFIFFELDGHGCGRMSLRNLTRNYRKLLWKESELKHFLNPVKNRKNSISLKNVSQSLSRPSPKCARRTQLNLRGIVRYLKQVGAFIFIFNILQKSESSLIIIN